MIRYLIWDFDGTLFDTYPAINRAIVAALEDLGGAAPLNRVAALTRRSIGSCLSRMADEFDIDADELLRRFHLRYRATSLQKQPPFPGAVAVCQLVNTSGGKNAIVTHRARTSVERFLDVYQIASLFVDCVTGDDGYPRKPDPSSFETVMDRNGFVRRETLAVGDRALDVRTGRAAGIRTCLFGAPLDGVEPDLVIEDYTELYQFIQRMV